MNIHDFRFMWRGKPIAPLLSQQAHLLDPIDIRGKGHDRALLLLHGYSSSPAVFRAMLPELTMYDAVVCPVLPGHADSVRVFADSTGADWLAAAEGVCGALLQEYKAVDVLGFSLGGLLAYQLSQRFKLNHLYLLAPSMNLHMNVPATLLLARALHWLGFRFLRSYGGDMYTDHYQELTYRQLPIATVIEILTLVHHLKFAPPSCPTDLFLGRFDAVVNSSQVVERFEGLANVTIHWLEHSAHVLPLDGDIEAIVDCLRAHRL